MRDSLPLRKQITFRVKTRPGRAGRRVLPQNWLGGSEASYLPGADSDSLPTDSSGKLETIRAALREGRPGPHHRRRVAANRWRLGCESLEDAGPEMLHQLKSTSPRFRSIFNFQFSTTIAKIIVTRNRGRRRIGAAAALRAWHLPST